LAKDNSIDGCGDGAISFTSTLSLISSMDAETENV
jgi:hypothetical protein